MDEEGKVAKKLLESVGLDVNAIIHMLFFIVFGFILSLLCFIFFGKLGDISFVLLLFFPIILYLVITGKINEIAAFGLTAKFYKTASQKIKLSKVKIAKSIQEIYQIEKESTDSLLRKLEEYSESQYLILTIIVKKREIDYYDKDIFYNYLNFLAGYTKFKFIVFLNDSSKLIAYMPVWYFIEIIRNSDLTKRFLDIINSGNKAELLEWPGIYTQPLKLNSTNADALRIMEENNLDTVIVVDGYNNLKGVIERDQIINKMMLSLLDR